MDKSSSTVNNKLINVLVVSSIFYLVKKLPSLRFAKPAAFDKIGVWCAGEKNPAEMVCNSGVGCQCGFRQAVIFTDVFVR